MWSGQNVCVFRSNLASSDKVFKLLKKLLNLDTEETKSSMNKEHDTEKQSEDYAATLSCYGADTEASAAITVPI